MNELALFAGAGGGILGGHLLGWRCVCAVEFNAYARSVLLARQNDRTLAPFPIWDDVRTFDGRPWRGIVDVVSGGFPCQDISAAGQRKGISGEKSGLWSEMARVVGEVRPRHVFVENSPAITNRGLGRVLGDLSALGYDARWTVMGAADIGAHHQRDRFWLVANSNDQADGEQLAHAKSRHDDQKDISGVGRPICEALPTRFDYWVSEPRLGRMAHGVAHRVDRIKAIGNGQVPQVAATAWTVLSKEITTAA